MTGPYSSVHTVGQSIDSPTQVLDGNDAGPVSDKNTPVYKYNLSTLVKVGGFHPQ